MPQSRSSLLALCARDLGNAEGGAIARNDGRYNHDHTRFAAPRFISPQAIVFEQKVTAVFFRLHVVH